MLESALTVVSLSGLAGLRAHVIDPDDYMFFGCSNLLCSSLGSSFTTCVWVLPSALMS